MFDRNQLHRLLWLAAAALALLGVLSACASDDEPETLRIAVLPILDNLPMYVAEQEGYFADENLTVEFIPVNSAAERDQVIQAGQADGMINEIIATLFYNAETPRVTIVRYARVATPDYPEYRVLASAASGITTVEELKGVPIGISEGTIIEYTTDRLLQLEGLTDEEIVTAAVPGISDRMALLASGELDAANLPDPLASLAIQSGAVVVIDDTAHPEVGHSTYAFLNDVVEENPDAIRRFLAALERAVEAINADKEKYGDLLVERQLVPEPLIGSYTVPDFPTASVPPESQWNDVLAWAQAKGYVSADVSYQQSVDDSFLSN
jgi:NitT/TauT family transport system substrate-binding protein